MVHSWEETAGYERALELLKSNDAGIADYSVPPWRPVNGSDDDIEMSIRARISMATTVVVLNTPGIHKRKYSSFEMKTAAELRKRIVVLQPHGNFWHPIPQALDGQIYRVAPWRSDILGRAVRGEYPQDGRVFDIAEQVERRALVEFLSIGVGITSLVLLSRSVGNLVELYRELAIEGIQLQWTSQSVGEVAKQALVGAVIVGGIAAILTGDGKSTLLAAAAGGAAVAAIGVARSYRAALHGTREVRVLSLEPG